MGLDAFVRCRCFEEGKLKPGPIPFEDPLQLLSLLQQI